MIMQQSNHPAKETTITKDISEKSQRRIHTLIEVPKKLLTLFFLLYILFPALYFILVAMAIGWTGFISIGKTLLILVLPITIVFTVLFIYINSKLSKTIDRLLSKPSEDELPEIEDFINTFPVKTAVILFVGSAIAPILIGIIGMYKDIFFSFLQVFSMVLVGEIIALVAGNILFYYGKVYLYPSNRKISFKPLSIFHKFSIPILSLVLVLFTIMSIFLYRIFKTEIHTNRNNLMAKTLINTKNQYNSFLVNALTELESYAKTDLFKSMKREPATKFLKNIHKVKGNNIEMYFFAYPNGIAPPSIGPTANLKDRRYFQEVMIEKKDRALSDALISRATKKSIIVAAVPIKKGNRRVGLIGATIRIQTINDMLSKTDVGKTAKYIIFNPKGKIVYSPEKEQINKIIGKDIIDDGSEFKNINNLLKQKNHIATDIKFNHTDYIAYKSSIPINDNNIVLMIEKAEFYESIDAIILRVTSLLVAVSIALYMVILTLSKKISRPIKNIVDIFQKVSDGDLTVKSTDYLADEFGELVRFLQILLTRLNNIIHSTIESTKQLSEASSSLSKISQTLSTSAQDQAASVEELTASLEETSSSIDMISANSKEQSSVATATYEAMQKLKNIILEISGSAEEALKTAIHSSGEAQKGNELMQYTIKGMESIENSTEKISEFVVMISAISDQVNLLALNAAIEAARAGDHGKGFAVVADEISKLAEETSASAKNITELVNSGKSEVTRGKNYVDQTSDSLFTIIENVQKTDSLVKEITEASRQQTESSNNVLAETQKVMQVADNISTATEEQMKASVEMTNTINQINNSTQAVASEAEEVASSAEEINAQSESLYYGIQFFKVREQ
jgi:methyl-accepting chemotaxis protein